MPHDTTDALWLGLVSPKMWHALMCCDGCIFSDDGLHRLQLQNFCSCGETAHLLIVSPIAGVVLLAQQDVFILYFIRLDSIKRLHLARLVLLV